MSTDPHQDPPTPARQTDINIFPIALAGSIFGILLGGLALALGVMGVVTLVDFHPELADPPPRPMGERLAWSCAYFVPALLFVLAAVLCLRLTRMRR